jgi:CheY-like chemotaxis protein
MAPFFKSILLVDDDVATNHYHEIMLTEWGVTEAVYKVGNGEEALDFLRTHQCEKPSLIMLDINMPVMNGFEFLEQYEFLQPHEKVSYVVFMLTSSMHPNDVNKAGEMEALNGYCEKPMTEEMVLDVIDKIQKEPICFV